MRHGARFVLTTLAASMCLLLPLCFVVSGEEAPEEIPEPEIAGTWGGYQSNDFEIFCDSFEGEEKVLAELSEKTPVSRLIKLVGWEFHKDNYFRKMRYPDLWIRHPAGFNQVVRRSIVLLAKKPVDDQTYQRYAQLLTGENYQAITAMSYYMATEDAATGRRTADILMDTLAETEGPEKRWVLANAMVTVSSRIKRQPEVARRLFQRVISCYKAEYDPEVRLQLADSMAVLGGYLCKDVAETTKAKAALRFFEKPIGSRRLVLLVDHSGSMTDLLPLIRRKLIRFLQTLPPETEFNVGFFAAGRPVWLAESLVSAEQYKEKAIELVKRIDAVPVSDTVLDGPLTKAFAFKPDEILVVSDGDFSVRVFGKLPELRRANPDTTVSTFLIVYQSGEAAMKVLARSGGGEYTFVPLTHFEPVTGGN